MNTETVTLYTSLHLTDVKLKANTFVGQRYSVSAYFNHCTQPFSLIHIWRSWLLPTTSTVFFAERVINVWNSLPSDFVDFSTLKSFSRWIKTVDLSGYCIGSSAIFVTVINCVYFLIWWLSFRLGLFSELDLCYCTLFVFIIIIIIINEIYIAQVRKSQRN